MPADHSFCKPLYSSARLGLGLGGDCTVPRSAGRFCLATPLPIFAISQGHGSKCPRTHFRCTQFRILEAQAFPRFT